MAEYFTVLKRAVAGLTPNVPETRRAVYDKARNALIGQLKAVDPPLTTAEISRQRLELEEAIRRVEREAASTVSAQAAASRAQTAAPPPVAKAPSPPPPVAAPAEEAAEAAASPQDVFRRAMQEAGARGAESAMRAPAARAAPAPYAPPRVEPPPPPAEPDYPEAEDTEATLAPEYEGDWNSRQAPPPPPPPSPAAERRSRIMPPPPPPPVARREREYVDRATRDADERPARRSRLPSILLTILILGVIGGLGALAWSQRAVITDLIASFESGGSAAKKPKKPDNAEPAKVATAAADESSKNTDRLPQPGDQADGAPAADRDVRVVEPEPAATAVTPDAATDAAPDAADAAPAADEPLPEAVAAAAPAAEAAAPAEAAPASEDSLVAQKAILYEEPVEGAANGVTAINAAVTWDFAQDGPAGPEVRATIDVPERKMKIKLTVRKNTDASLPASHLIEVVIDAPPDFPGKGIRSVPRIVLKPTEDSSGKPLVAAAAKVADGFFWIALSASDADMESNVGLLREREWIDLPLVYETGQRAILTFEKGTPGDRVFDKAITAWAK